MAENITFHRLAVLAAVTTGTILGLLSMHGPAVNAGPLRLSPVNVSIVLLPTLFVLSAFARPLRWVFIVVGAGILTGLWCHASDLAGLTWQNCALPGALSSLAWGLAVAWLKPDIMNQDVEPLADREKQGLIAFTVFVVVAYRLTYALLADLPDDKRSLFVNGVEVHHINLGVFALLASLIAWRWARLRLMGLLLIGFGSGSIIDQSGYYLLGSVTDTAYSEVVSWLGAIIAMLIFAIAVQIVGVPWWGPDAGTA
jgi:hypothetical protein